MQLTKPTADLFIPDGAAEAAALARTTHLGIGAHQDDLEIMAFHGIMECFMRRDKWFTGVTCTDGAGSPRAGIYADYTNAEMAAVRPREQRKAAVVGDYAAQFQLGYTSAEVKDPAGTACMNDLVAILQATTPRVVYTHNPADKHPTHIGTTVNTLKALRALPPDRRPEKVVGCEVWRDLDWLPDTDKVAMNVSGRDGVAMALIGVYDSQVAGGKRYDLASQGRRLANATYFASHGTDQAESLIFGMDLTPLLDGDTLDLVDYVGSYLDAFANDVKNALRRQLGG